jgi:methyl-accepting chemotaxis protein
MKRRSTYLVNNRLQLTILFYGFILAMSGNGIITIFQNLTSGQFNFMGPTGMYWFAIGISFVLCLLLVLLGLMVSNRIAGPIHNLKNHMEAVLENKGPAPLNIRKDDYFSEIVEPYNSLIAKVK